MVDSNNSYRENSVTLKDVKIMFRNLAGLQTQFNAAGERNFSVLLDEATAKDLLERRWRVKKLKDQDDGTPGDYHIKVKANYKTGRPPRVILITSKGRTELGADEIGMIDVADVESVDLVLNGWYSDMNGGGFSAYLKTMVVKIREDELELLYASVPPAEEHAELVGANWSE